MKRIAIVFGPIPKLNGRSGQKKAGSSSATVGAIYLFLTTLPIQVELAPTERLQKFACVCDLYLRSIQTHPATKRHHRGSKISADLKLPMADSLILAKARGNNATFWTQDEHFKDLDGIKHIGKNINHDTHL